jgi:hypothetical protein
MVEIQSPCAGEGDKNKSSRPTNNKLLGFGQSTKADIGPNARPPLNVRLGEGLNRTLIPEDQDV